MIESRNVIVTFNAPFTLPGLERDYPAGDYSVRIDEEALDVSFAASRRVATAIMLVSGATTLAWPVDPKDLDAALAGDARRPAPPKGDAWAKAASGKPGSFGRRFGLRRCGGLRVRGDDHGVRGFVGDRRMLAARVEDQPFTGFGRFLDGADQEEIGLPPAVDAPAFGLGLGVVLGVDAKHLAGEPVGLALVAIVEVHDVVRVGHLF